MQNPARRLNRQLRRSRLVLYTMLPIAAVASAGLMDTIQPGLRLLYILLGFSLIIFLHEFGHFIVARLCSVKCLAFSLGIGPRVCGWKKGVGFNFGAEPNTVEITKEDAHQAADQQVGVTLKEKTSNLDKKDVGDCDYRLSWLPLGGYVRMLGQDDMDPTKVSTDPNAFNQRPIWQRMCIVSAGVIMNLIFAAVCFSIIFSPGIGVDFPPARRDVPATPDMLRRSAVRPAQRNALGSVATKSTLVGPTGQPFAELLARWADTRGRDGFRSPGRCPGLGERPGLRPRKPLARILAAPFPAISRPVASTQSASSPIHRR